MPKLQEFVLKNKKGLRFAVLFVPVSLSDFIFV